MTYGTMNGMPKLAETTSASSKRALHQHKDAEKQIGAVAASLTAAMGALALIGAGMQLASLTGFGSAVSWVLGGIRGLLPFMGALAPWLADLVPIVGWISLAIGALMVAQRLPDIVAALTKWWAQYQGVIGYTIGYVFGTIGRLIAAACDGILTMATMAINAGYTAFKNGAWKLALGTQGGEMLAYDIANSVHDALKNYHGPTGPSFGGSFGGGIKGGLEGHAYNTQPYQPVIVHKLEINVSDTGDPDANADSMFRKFQGVTHPLALTGKSGAFVTHPLISNTETVGSLTL